MVLMGGRSTEREISIKSGEAVLKALRQLGHEAIALDLSEGLCQKLKEVKPDKVFIALHGTYGEDGRIQGLLDLLGIDYVGSGVMGSSIAMDKDITKKIVSYQGVPVPRWICLRSPQEDFRWEHYPSIVKPADQGSSVGLFLAKNEKEVREAIDRCFKVTRKVMIEEYIEGKDITVGILKHEALPPIEIRPKKGIYDYESKYTRGMSEYVFVEDKDLVEKLQELALTIHTSLELRDFSRIDFRLSREGKPYFLEVNTIPGLTELSLFPMACKRAGIDFTTMISKLLS
ncbi:MAG: D-alanine--D-alanine ligase [Aquificaceae bacterium]|nr:D-alanine--D-alanine ligase [Aquificaceae bacterium]